MLVVDIMANPRPKIKSIKYGRVVQIAPSGGELTPENARNIILHSGAFPGRIATGMLEFKYKGKIYSYPVRIEKMPRKFDNFLRRTALR